MSTYHPTLTAAFNHPRWAKLELTHKQVNAVGTQLAFTFSRDAKDRPVASAFVEYTNGAVPMKLEVFRVSVADNGVDCVYEMRLGVDLPEFMVKTLGESVTTTDGETILL